MLDRSQKRALRRISQHLIPCTPDSFFISCFGARVVCLQTKQGLRLSIDRSTFDRKCGVVNAKRHFYWSSPTMGRFFDVKLFLLQALELLSIENQKEQYFLRFSVCIVQRLWKVKYPVNRSIKLHLEYDLIPASDEKCNCPIYGTPAVNRLRMKHQFWLKF